MHGVPVFPLYVYERMGIRVPALEHLLQAWNDNRVYGRFANDKRPEKKNKVINKKKPKKEVKILHQQATPMDEDDDNDHKHDADTAEDAEFFPVEPDTEEEKKEDQSPGVLSKIQSLFGRMRSSSSNNDVAAEEQEDED